MTQQLLADGANANAVDANKDSALMLAVRAAQVPVVEALLAAGAWAGLVDIAGERLPMRPVHWPPTQRAKTAK